MELPIYVVDAFTKDQFKGNSAAVVMLESWLDDSVMQNIAKENNLSETAFMVPTNQNSFEIRWFSPLTEIDFCGHATLAASHVLFFELDYTGAITFLTRKVGQLAVTLTHNNAIKMSFPIQTPTPISNPPAALFAGLSIKPSSILRNRQAYFAIYESETDVRNIEYDSEQLKQLAPFDVVVSAPSSKYDFVSRYFWPANGGDEDPVTGSIHSGLAPYWSEQLNKKELLAFQASNRGGILKCAINEDRIDVAGHSALYLKGKIFI